MDILFGSLIGILVMVAVVCVVLPIIVGCILFFGLWLRFLIL